MVAFRTVATQRLLLMMPTPEEAPAVVRYFERNRRHLEPWEPARPEGFYTHEFWAERLRQNRQELTAGVALRLFMVTRNLPSDHPERVVGSCNFSNIIRGAFQSCTLGYGLDAAHVGQGLMEEALRTMVPLTFELFDLHRIQANYQPTNERSGRLLRRLGFAVEGYARDYLCIDGRWRDHVLTAKLREQR